ncbi:glycosyl hydrolase [Chitinophaga rhizophila]|uniref:Glycoside hydrolase n=1 Tax=Chitinophaga rhizophila TaxID=2866212 RepID=A0ABS7GJ97_9BACT|nr:glycosyl hydrolase [Chitinophaga rhizophila]MBW8687788.1 glycoside hydrolase [Chitinophaga rhizophila]
MRTVIRTFRWIVPAILLSASIQSVEAQPASLPPQSRLTLPWTRWWWIGSAVDEKELDISLKMLKDAGFGGVEIAPIYGAKGYESRYVSFLSPRWVDLLRHTVTSAARNDMSVDLTTGTGWPFGGPQVARKDAASRIIVQQYQARGNTPFSAQIKVKEPKQQGAVLQALTAYKGDERIPLMDKVDKEGNLKWTPPAGEWEVYALFSGWTLQQVKRAAPGGEGYTLDHLSAEALPVYLHRFDTAFKGKAPGVRAFYNDSYEVYNADWTPAFFTAFEKNRGYDLRKYIRELASNDSTDLVCRIKSDYRETMSEMLLDNFTRPWTKWAHGYKGVTKNQAHGSPGNLLDLYAAVDIPECETYGSTYFPIPGLRRDSADVRNVDPDPVMLKFASSAAHVAGHPLVSCETFTWLTEHFKTSLSQCKPEVEQAFLAGVNHVFYHGNTFSPQDVPWPGWLFYASVNFVPTNSFWTHVGGLNSYIANVQSVLQTGTADNELLIYWPVYDSWKRPKGKDMSLKVHDIDEWLYPTAFYKQVTALQKAGYSLDFISDGLLKGADVANGEITTNPAAAPYKVLIVPKASLIPVATLEQMISLAEKGATVIFESLPGDVPGLGNLEARRKEFKALLSKLSFKEDNGSQQVVKRGKGQVILSSNVQAALENQGIARETLADQGLRFIRRKDKNSTWYYIVNHTPEKIDQTIPLNKLATTAVITDPISTQFGAIRVSERNGKKAVRLQLLPGQSLLLQVGATLAAGTPQWTYLDAPGNPLTLSGPWQLTFTNGGPFKPADRKLDRLASWTTLSDTAANAYSGAAVYTQTFNLPEKAAKEYVLDLGKVHESARVTINGKDAGIYWAIPFRGRIGAYLRPGKNEIKIEVANLMANRMKYMDQHAIQWRNYHEINFVNINYTAFNAADWPLQPSGLVGPVTITPYK